eukprot:GHRR01030715.1.p1 GENE.GHRR01030715.1~~GHRR01030715.1.p1  ORF type:complete len:119 (+),score=22.62 GHRR01030715.1:881-1237(+)
MSVLATERIYVPCMRTLLISSLLCTRRSLAPAKLTPLGSSLIVTTGRGTALLAHNRSRTSSCKPYVQLEHEVLFLSSDGHVQLQQQSGSNLSCYSYITKTYWHMTGSSCSIQNHPLLP